MRLLCNSALPDFAGISLSKTGSLPQPSKCGFANIFLSHGYVALSAATRGLQCTCQRKDGVSMARQHSESVLRLIGHTVKIPREAISQSWPRSCIVHCSRPHFCPLWYFGFQGIFYIVLERTLGPILVPRVFSMVCVSEPTTCNTRVVARMDFASRAGGCCSVTLFAIL